MGITCGADHEQLQRTIDAQAEKIKMLEAELANPPSEGEVLASSAAPLEQTQYAPSFQAGYRRGWFDRDAEIVRMRGEIAELHKRIAEHSSSTAPVYVHMDRCNVTGLPSFCAMSEPDWDGEGEPGMVMTFGGALDSYTSCELDEEGQFCHHRYCHDQGAWVEYGGVSVYAFYDQDLFKAVGDEDSISVDKLFEVCAMLGKRVVANRRLA